jgi:legumain
VALQNLTDNGRGRVLENTPQDRVFVYFSDHGAPGVLGMPSGPFLYADQLNEVITKRSRHRGFQEMVVYIEACESGSLFEVRRGGRLRPG